jgi:hypothetical protein
VPAGALSLAETQEHARCDHRQVRQLRKLRHAGVRRPIISGLSGHRCSDDCCDSAALNKLKTVAPAVVLYPPRNTTPYVTLSALPARVPAPRSWIHNPNVNPFVPGHYAEARTRKSMIRAPFRELHGPHNGWRFEAEFDPPSERGIM